MTPTRYLWLGTTTFLLGAALWWLASQTARGRLWPTWTRRLGVALLSLGLSTLAQTQSGLWWRISSMCFSLVAIVLLVWVLRENMRR